MQELVFSLQTSGLFSPRVLTRQQFLYARLIVCIIHFFFLVDSSYYNEYPSVNRHFDGFAYYCNCITINNLSPSMFPLSQSSRNRIPLTSPIQKSSISTIMKNRRVYRTIRLSRIGHGSSVFTRIADARPFYAIARRTILFSAFSRFNRIKSEVFFFFRMKDIFFFSFDILRTLLV